MSEERGREDRGRARRGGEIIGDERGEGTKS
jgi:hypothetical protein